MLKRFIHFGLERAGLKLVKSHKNRFDLSLYEHIEDCQKNPRFINIGSGNFYHPCWFNLDKPNNFYEKDQSKNAFINHDLNSSEALPFANDSIEVFYCSHVIEHLPINAVQKLFKEFYRCLKPKGYFRITCPDIELLYNAYKRGDLAIWPNPSPWNTCQSSLELRFVEHFATLLVDPHANALAIDKPSPMEIRSIAREKNMNAFLDQLIKKLPDNCNELFPEGHCNWFSEEKVIYLLHKAGLINAKSSRYGQSEDPRLRNTDLFDKTCPELSLYVEGRK